MSIKTSALTPTIFLLYSFLPATTSAIVFGWSEGAAGIGAGAAAWAGAARAISSLAWWAWSTATASSTFARSDSLCSSMWRSSELSISKSIPTIDKNVKNYRHKLHLRALDIIAYQQEEELYR